MFVGAEGELVIVGCTSGMDFKVAQDGNEMILTSEGGREYVVGAKEWRRAVCQLSDAFHEFYTWSAPKEPSEDAPAFELFMAEWEHRRSLVALE
jgi:hypothetical protein